MLKVNSPLVLTARSLPPLFWSTSPVPERPVTVTPTLCVSTQLTTTLLTSAAPTVPEPFATAQNWPAGWVATVTE